MVRPAAVSDLEMLREPEKELDPAFVPMIRPAVVRLPVAWRPRFKFKLPWKELEAAVFWVMAPEILAVPRSSKVVETEAKVDWSEPMLVMLNPPAAMAPPRVKPLIWVADKVLIPETLLLPKAKAPERLRPARLEVPAVVKPPAVTFAVAVRDFERFKLPANELDPVPDEKS